MFPILTIMILKFPWSLYFRLLLLNIEKLSSCNKTCHFHASGSVNEENADTDLFVMSPNTSEEPLLEKESKRKKKKSLAHRKKYKESIALMKKKKLAHLPIVAAEASLPTSSPTM